ncbi:MAG: hypothetical protein GX767_02670, partial [Firmicutes bacterium]|nr:hypothetical protein [Bacillota bacterium]
ISMLPGMRIHLNDGSLLFMLPDPALEVNQWQKVASDSTNRYIYYGTDGTKVWDDQLDWMEVLNLIDPDLKITKYVISMGKGIAHNYGIEGYVDDISLNNITYVLEP